MPFCSSKPIATLALGLALLCLPRFALCDVAAAAVAGPVFHPSLRAATEAAALDQGMVLLVFGAEWCGPCKELKRKTLASREFTQQGGPLHIVEIDVDSDPASARGYGVEAVPTLVLLTADNKIIARQEGFIEVAELMLWLRDGRERIRSGKWEGTVQTSKLNELVQKADAGELDTNDVNRLIGMLGDPNPADREAATRLLVNLGEPAMNPLIQAITNTYLGIRIAAAETLHRLAPEALVIEPWQSPAQLSKAVEALEKWWAATQTLPSRDGQPQLSRSIATSVESALASLRSNDPTKRTEAMSSLVTSGPGCLPEIRAAIKSSEKAGDQRSLTLLEDIRWAILIPDDLDQKSGGVRTTISRGKGPDRQSAAIRLGRAGSLAVPALAELLQDADPLVVESAVRALSGVGGKDVVSAIAALLKAVDSNLRMTAAQALGRTKNTAAAKQLLGVFDDPNEVVACTALSALDEISGEPGYSSNKKIQSPDVIDGLRRCLRESRWRVRAAAAEVTGNLGINELADELEKLLDDSDGFVVKNALQALQKIGATPAPQKLLLLANKHAELRNDALSMLLKRGTDDAVAAVTDMYHSASTDARIEIVQSLAVGTQENNQADQWAPVLKEAVADPDARVRRAVAYALSAQSPKIASSLVQPLLSDQDCSVRVSAAQVVLGIIGGERLAVISSHGRRITQTFVSAAENTPGDPQNRRAPTNEPPATAEQISAWHDALKQKCGTNLDLVTAVAIYVTGSSNSAPAELNDALKVADRSALDRLGQSPATAALMPRLSWPEGKSIVEGFCASPLLFLNMAAYSRQCSQSLRDFLLDPQRFRLSVEPVSVEDLEPVLQRLLDPQQKGWSLLSSDPYTIAVNKSLLKATNALWRAAALYSLGLSEDSEARPALERGLSDQNRWVRTVAVNGLARTVKERATLERLLAPLLSDPDKNVAWQAAIGLLEPETRSAAGLDYESGYFEFEKVRIWSMIYDSGGPQRPLSIIQGKPAFLDVLRDKIARSSPEDAASAALLLAQYGDFTGLDVILKAALTENHAEYENLVLTAIGLSRNEKYLPYLKNMFAAASPEGDSRRFLQALRGMAGAEARELRREINRRLRQAQQ